MRRVLFTTCLLGICIMLLAASRGNAEADKMASVGGPINALATFSLPSKAEEESTAIMIEKEVREEPTFREEVVQSPVQQPKGRWVEVAVTAYTPFDAIDSRSGFQDGYTSIMVNTQSGNPNHMYGIAADPRVLPYGTEIYVPGYWEALQRNKVSKPTRMTRVDDTGGAMRRSWRRYGVIHIDLRFRTTRGARNWLRRNAHRGWTDRNNRLRMRVFVYE